MSQMAVRPVSAQGSELDVSRLASRRTPIGDGYDRDSLDCGIAFLGSGALHASQLPLLIDRYLKRRSGDWMIHGVACGEDDLRLCGSLNVNDGMFGLLERPGRSESLRNIGSIKRMTHAPSRPEQVERILVSEKIQIVAVTLQASGYPLDLLGDLDVNDQSIRNDLRDAAAPRSIIGHLYLAASNRMRMGARGFTVLCCDDIERNGQTVGRLLLQFAELKDSAVAEWIRDHVTFPNSLMDVALPVDEPASGAITMTTSRGPCVTNAEPSANWVIEDRFAGDRPLLGLVGVTFTDHIEPYELIRARLLGSARMALAYVGSLLGHPGPAAAMNDKAVQELLNRLLSESTAGLTAPHGVDLEFYAAGVIQRLGAGSDRDGMAQLAAEGSRRMSSTLAAVISSCLDNDISFDASAFAVAAWCRYLRGVDERGAIIDIDDPLASQLTSRAGISPRDPAHLLAMSDVFGRRLSNDDDFLRAVAKWLAVIDRLGVRNALDHLVNA